MSDVIRLFCPQNPDEQEPDGPHLAGEFICGACSHQWIGVAPVGVTHCECPKCHRFWGAVKNAVEPDNRWVCNCGETLFYLTPNGSMCRRCGTISSDWAN